MNTRRTSLSVSRGPQFARRTSHSLALALAAMIALLLGLACFSHAQDAGAEYAPGELIIKFKADATNAQVQEAFQKGKLGNVKRTFKLKKGHPSSLHLMATDMDVPSAALALSKHPAVEYAEPNYKVYPTAVPNDPSYSQLWAMPKISAPAAWDVTTGTSGVIIGVADTGIDTSHPDLAPNIWTNTGEVLGDGIDNDNNGYIDDVNGWDWWNGDNTVFDSGEAGHGTHVAGTIGAAGNNGTGVAGLNWQVKILPLKFIGPEVGYFSGAIAAIEYAADKGVKVLNLSFGSNFYGQGFSDAIESAGILLVASAGNSSANNDNVPHYPSGFDLGNVISVAATDSSDKLASFSNYGLTEVDLGAPGGQHLQHVPGEPVCKFAGHVDGRTARYGCRRAHLFAQPGAQCRGGQIPDSFLHRSRLISGWKNGHRRTTECRKGRVAFRAVVADRLRWIRIQQFHRRLGSLGRRLDNFRRLQHPHPGRARGRQPARAVAPGDGLPATHRQCRRCHGPLPRIPRESQFLRIRGCRRCFNQHRWHELDLSGTIYHG